MISVPVVAASYRRAGRVVTRSWWKDVILAVHESEAEQYRAQEGEPLLVLSDESRGNMARVRNAILEAMGERAGPDGWFLMVDDDLEEVGQFGARSNPLRQVRMEPDRIAEFLSVGCQMAEDLECRLWGINLQYDPRFYREYSPFSFTSPVLGGFSCIRPNPLRYDDRIPLNEDYDYFLQHVHRYRRVLRFNRVHYRTVHYSRPGGTAAYRTTDAERDQAKAMQRKWGEEIVRFDFSHSFNPVIRVPIPGL